MLSCAIPLGISSKAAGAAFGAAIALGAAKGQHAQVIADALAKVFLLQNHIKWYWMVLNCNGTKWYQL